MGFSVRTCTPARAARMAHSSCSVFGSAMYSASTSSRVSTSSRSSYRNAGTPYRAPSALRFADSPETSADETGVLLRVRERGEHRRLGDVPESDHRVADRAPLGAPSPDAVACASPHRPRRDFRTRAPSPICIRVRPARKDKGLGASTSPRDGGRISRRPPEEPCSPEKPEKRPRRADPGCSPLTAAAMGATGGTEASTAMTSRDSAAVSVSPTESVTLPT